LGVLLGNEAYATCNEDELFDIVNTPAIPSEIFGQYYSFIMELFKDSDNETVTDEGLISRSVIISKFVSSLIGKELSTRHLPAFTFSTNESFKLGLIAGLLDVSSVKYSTNSSFNSTVFKDGHTFVDGELVFYNSSLRIIQELQHLLFSLNINSKIYYAKEFNNIGAWGLSVRFEDLRILDLKLTVKYKNELSTYSSGLNRVAVRDFIPISTALVNRFLTFLSILGITDFDSVLVEAEDNGYIDRDVAVQIISIIGLAAIPIDWLNILLNDRITWCTVDEVVNTNKKETGYDLTVPGYETFVSVDGIVLSNTMNYHVPVSAEAVQEAIEKMLPEKNLLTPRTFQAHYRPIRAAGLGIYLASQPPKGLPKKVFRNKEEALQAYRKGEIDVDTPIQIKEL
jgi:hypothetical protein